MNWKCRKYEAGSLVKVLDLDGNDRGTGFLLYDFDMDGDNVMPEIRMENGEILLGCECWWVPVDEVDDGEQVSS